MSSLIDSLRQIIGTPAFYFADGTVDYSALVEYMLCGIILCIVVSSIFRFLFKVVER